MNRNGRSLRSSKADEASANALRCFVRERRLRLSPELRILGDRRRLPVRVGKPVTQEELAEHLEISRGWYARFESGASAGFSISLLSRLSNILRLSVAERAELVRLAIPDLASVAQRDSSALYEAFGVIRRAVKRLWRATSEGEILNVAGEEARHLLPCFEVIFARRILSSEEIRFLHPGSKSAARLADARSHALRRLSHSHLAQLEALWQRTDEGAILESDAYPTESVHLYRVALYEHGIDWDRFVVAHIRKLNGSAVVGGASTRPHDVPELERTMLSTIADFASLALQKTQT
jgi:transcriptional regulator with XRE-family HTH domain